MVATLKFLAKGLGLFLLWAVIGAVIYSVGTNLLARQGDAEAITELNSGLGIDFEPLGEMLIEGDAVLMTTVTTGPTDLEFDSEGVGYVLDEKGLVFRIKPNGGGRDSVPWLILPNDHTERAVPFRTMALHPGFLDPDSRGYGRFYTVEPERAATGIPDFSPEVGS